MLRRLRRRPNVRLVDPYTSSHELIRAPGGRGDLLDRRARGAALRKPVLTLGQPFYAGYGVTLDVDSFAEIRESVPELLRFRPDPERITRFLHAAMRRLPAGRAGPRRPIRRERRGARPQHRGRSRRGSRGAARARSSLDPIDRHAHTTVLFWDLDGTLLKTGRAGILAFEAAVKEVTGVEVDLEEPVHVGPHRLAGGRVGPAGGRSEPEPAVVEALLRSYERGLPEALPKRQGEVMPNIREVLADLEGHPAVRSMLLTGNTPAGARAKLAYYGLDRYFGDEGGFSIGPESRPEIGRRALQLAGHADAVFVIGDTPHDVECGRAIDAKTVAVASGWHTPDELAACDPWLLLERIPEPGRFRSLLGLDA